MVPLALTPMWLKIQVKRGRMIDMHVGQQQEFKISRTSRPLGKKILIQRERTKVRLRPCTRPLEPRNRRKILPNQRRPSSRLTTEVTLKTKVTPRTLILAFGPHLIIRNQIASNNLTQTSPQRTRSLSKALGTPQDSRGHAEQDRTTRSMPESSN